jgi:hypothetical protein
MMNLLKFIDARLGEPSTWAALAAMLTALHVNVDPGLLHALTVWGAGISGALGFLLTETQGGKSAGQVAQDVLAALVAVANRQNPPGPPGQPH